MSTLDHLPVHPVPPEVQASAGSESSLLVDGLVDRPWRFTPAELAGLRRGKFDDNFVCLEGWTVEGQGSDYYVEPILPPATATPVFTPAA